MIEKLRTETIVKVDSNIDLGNLHIKAVGFNENDEMIMESLPNLVETRETLNPKAKMLFYKTHLNWSNFTISSSSSICN